jgi:hypothetical protein
MVVATKSGVCYFHGRLMKYGGTNYRDVNSMGRVQLCHVGDSSNTSYRLVKGISLTGVCSLQSLAYLRSRKVSTPSRASRRRAGTAEVRASEHGGCGLRAEGGARSGA